MTGAKPNHKVMLFRSVQVIYPVFVNEWQYSYFKKTTSGNGKDDRKYGNHIVTSVIVFQQVNIKRVKYSRYNTVYNKSSGKLSNNSYLANTAMMFSFKTT